MKWSQLIIMAWLKFTNKKNLILLYYARKAFYIAREAPFFKQVLEISGFMTDIFKDKKTI